MDNNKIEPLIREDLRGRMGRWLASVPVLPAMDESFMFHPMMAHLREWYKLIKASNESLILMRWSGPDGLYWKDYKYLLDMVLVWRDKRWIDNAIDIEGGSKSIGDCDLPEIGQSVSDYDTLGGATPCRIPGLTVFLAWCRLPAGSQDPWGEGEIDAWGT